MADNKDHDKMNDENVNKDKPIGDIVDGARSDAQSNLQSGDVTISNPTAHKQHESHEGHESNDAEDLSGLHKMVDSSVNNDKDARRAHRGLEELKDMLKSQGVSDEKTSDGVDQSRDPSSSTTREHTPQSQKKSSLEDRLGLNRKDSRDESSEDSEDDDKNKSDESEEKDDDKDNDKKKNDDDTSPTKKNEKKGKEGKKGGASSAPQGDKKDLSSSGGSTPTQKSSKRSSGSVDPKKKGKKDTSPQKKGQPASGTQKGDDNKSSQGSSKRPSPFGGVVAGVLGGQRPGTPKVQEKQSALQSDGDAGQPVDPVSDSSSVSSPSPASEQPAPAELITPRSRTPHNKLEESPLHPSQALGDNGDDSAERPRPDFSPKIPTPPGKKARRAGCLGCGALVAIVMLIMVAFFSATGVMIPGTDHTMAEKELLSRQKCTLDDSGGVDPRAEGGAGPGGRGVPEGEIAKPALLGEPGTSDIDPSAGYSVITSEFGQRWGQLHAGIDIATNAPETELYSTDDGMVVSVDCVSNPTGYGCDLVSIHEDEGMGGTYFTLHGHMFENEIFVESGDEVAAGQKIAYMGNNGGSTGQHDHFEVREVQGSAQDLTQDSIETGTAGRNIFFSQTTPINPREYVERGINPDGSGSISSGGDRDKDDSDKKNDSSGSEKRSLSGKTADLIDAVLEPVGKKPYVFGGVGPDEFDCSGLMMWAYNKVGITIGRSTQQQKDEGEIIWDKQRDGGEIPEDKLRPGDLIFYQDFGHVAMYVGDGMIVNAATDGVPLDQQIQHEPIAEGGSTPPHRVVRIDDTIAGGSVSGSSRGSSGDKTEASYDNCECGSGETARSEYERTNGQNNPQHPETNYDKNADKIISIGEERGMSKEQIMFAIALSDANTGLSNLGNDNSQGNETLNGDEITSSLNHTPEGTTSDTGGRMGLFLLVAGVDGSVDELMDKEWSINYIYDKIEPLDVTMDNWDSVTDEMGISVPNKPQGFKDKAQKNYDNFSSGSSEGDRDDSSDENSSEDEGQEEDEENKDEFEDREEGKDDRDNESKNKTSQSRKDICSDDAKDNGSKRRYSEDLNTENIPEEYVDLIIDAANETEHITPPMLAAILYIESNFNPRASSGVANGIAQFTPSTWAAWGDGGDVWNPEDAIPASARFLDNLYEHSLKVLENNGGEGDDPMELMAASYNGGPGAVEAGACGTPARVPQCGDPNNFSSYAAQTYPYAKQKFPDAVEKFSK